MAEREEGNYVAEWFGHRVFPVVAVNETSLRDQRAKSCPFLTDVTGEQQQCVKREASRGVCTISSTSNDKRQDWLVCPFRAVDVPMLNAAARRLFAVPENEEIVLVAATVLADPATAEEFRRNVHSGKRCLVYFQNKLGGEITLPATDRSPEFSFDATMVEVVPSDQDGLALGRYGIFEIQTMDFHGTYANAVNNLKNALHLHSDDFGSAVAGHARWLGEKVEGPNIANVFKRTFYQMMFKFQIATHEQCAGCIFAIPQAVWDSWQKHLGRPELIDLPDGTQRLEVERNSTDPSSWLFVFDLDVSDSYSPNALAVTQQIGASAAALSHYALDVSPQAALEAGGSADRLLASIRARMAAYLPEFKPPRQTRGKRQLPADKRPAEELF